LLRTEAWLLRGRGHPRPFLVGSDVAIVSRFFRRAALALCDR
jgi:hypothetical protein